ncbi:MAG TPA: TIGR00282 family metallophosphoesterase [Firmicutes bacterium]|nr:TIGR00282 family metallophosphoesterase [Bacillota bacterium]
MRILFVGDVVGQPGRKALAEQLPKLRSQYRFNICVVNAENAAGGIGLTRKVAEELFALGADVLTMGNHVWDKKEIFDFIDTEERIVRPLNYPGPCPGRGCGAFPVPGTSAMLGVVNLSGRVFSPTHFDCPFRAAEQAVEELQDCHGILIDIHGEATSEKMALGWYLDGRVSAVVGTHTHVQTADNRVLPGGTAFISDVGMTGPLDSVIGIRKELVLERFLTQRPVKFELAKGRTCLSAVLIEVNMETRLAHSIERILLK